MFAPGHVILTFSLYMGTLFLLALWVERRARNGKHLARHPVVYTLSLAVYFTAWTYYGSVGSAARSGIFALAVYTGPMISATVWWLMLRRMVRVKNSERITSIADFLSARYGKSQAVAIWVTIIALVGIMPYIALQLKSIHATFDLLTQGTPRSGFLEYGVGPVVVILLIIFTIVLGARKLDATERHEGIVVVVAMESLVKLGVFILLGLIVVYGMFDGFGDLFGRLEVSQFKQHFWGLHGGDDRYQLWLTYIMLSTIAVVLLPRQFHLAVVENHRERSILTAMWLFPVYMLLIVLFILPIAFGSLLKGLPLDSADTFVLQLPMLEGSRWQALLVFLGGFSAATSMVIIGSMTLATMVTNHLLMPIFTTFKRLNGLQRHLLKFRWGAIACVILMGFWFDQRVSSTYSLVNIGIFSFAAIAQFAPAFVGGLFWKGGSRRGALAGLIGGFVVWSYTLLLPVFIRAGFLPFAESWLVIGPFGQEVGPFGLAFLNPEQLFGVTAFHPIVHSTLWSLSINTLLYILVSLASPDSGDERRMAEQVVDILEISATITPDDEPGTVGLVEKRAIIVKLLRDHFARPQFLDIMASLDARFGLRQDRSVSVLELAELSSEVERILTGSFGAATAHRAMVRAQLFTGEEQRRLSSVYGRILANLKISPEELRSKVDYYQERANLLSHHAAQLEATVHDRDQEIAERRKAELMLRESEERYRLLVEVSPTAIFIHAGGKLVYANSVGLELLGAKSRDDLLGQPIERFVPMHFSTELRKQARSTYETGQPLPLMEQRFIRMDGEEVDVDVTAIPFVYRNEPAFQVVAVDISARKRAEHERQILEAQVRQQQKLEAIGTLASGVAHEINNPVNAIMNYGQLISDRIADEGDLKLFADEIVKETERISKIVYNLLAFARQEREQRERVQLHEIIEATMMLVSTVVRKDRIDLQVDVSHDLPSFKCQSQQIQQVLMNLVTNARDAINQRFGTANDPSIARTITISACEITDDEGVWLRTSVDDNGIGMNNETKARIFDPFYTTKPRGVGTGLGLSVSHGIVKEHHGRLSAESSPGKGTTFHLDMPLD